MLLILLLCVGGSEDALVRRCTYAISRKKQTTWKIFLLIRHKNIQMINCA
mgnify:CR=1 FL=1